MLSAKCLGADVAYSFQTAAGTRNKRVRSGGLRLVRLAGLPMGFHRRASVVRLTVWKRALHGAATSCVPKTVYKKLRSKLCRGLRIDRAGRSPWLVGSMLTIDPIDPEFEVLMDRIRLCRQLAHSVPEWRRMLPDLWINGPGRYKGVTRRLLKQLESLGWFFNGDGTLSDAHDRRFDVERTSFVHIKRILKSSWLDKVAENCSHRKGLEEHHIRLTILTCVIFGGLISLRLVLSGSQLSGLISPVMPRLILSVQRGVHFAVIVPMTAGRHTVFLSALVPKI